jgi:translation elongation factor EF-1alpha
MHWERIRKNYNKMKENWITNTKINIIPTAGFEGMGVQNAYDIKITDKM